MKAKLLNAINELKNEGINNINLLALVSSTSYEVLFYGDYQGETYQSNSLAENDILNLNVLDNFYKRIATIIKSDKDYVPNKMNILIYQKDGSFNISHDEINCRVYKIKKEWKNKI